MFHLRTILRTCLPILLLLVACSSGPQLPQLQPGDVMLAFGDSLTHGTGAPQSSSYPAVLSRLSGYQVINAGVPGETSSEGLKRLPEVLDDTGPDLLLLCLGGNDMLRHQNLSATADHLRSMIRIARDRDIAVVLIGVPRPGIFLGTADFYEQIAKEMHVPIENEALPDILGNRSLKSDRVHPNAAGYQQLAQAILALLRDHGAL